MNTLIEQLPENRFFRGLIHGCSILRTKVSSKINFIKGSLNTDHEIDVILNPPESKLRIEAENISIEVLLIGIVPRTPP